MTTQETVYRLGFDTREVRDWRTAIVLHRNEFPASIMPGYWTSKGKWIKPHAVPAGTIVKHQDWVKTCRAFARVYGFCAAVYCDDTVVDFVLLPSGRVRQTKRHPAKVDWFADRKQA